MKKIFFSILYCLLSVQIWAQSKESFDNNSWQWIEYSGPEGEAIIKEGVMHLESKRDAKGIGVEDILDQVCTTAYAPMDPQQGFTMKCQALVKKIDSKKTFGIILDYKDNWNCILLQVKEDIAELYTVEKGHVTGYMRNQFKLGKQKKAELDFLVKYIDGTLELRVNDIMALKKKYVEITSNGIGFFAYGKMEVDFDNLEVF